MVDSADFSLVFNLKIDCESAGRVSVRSSIINDLIWISIERFINQAFLLLCRFGSRTDGRSVVSSCSTNRLQRLQPISIVQKRRVARPPQGMPIVQIPLHHRIVKRPTRRRTRRVATLERNLTSSIRPRSRRPVAMPATTITRQRTIITAPTTTTIHRTLLTMGWVLWAWARPTTTTTHHQYCRLRHPRLWVLRSMWSARKSCPTTTTTARVGSAIIRSATDRWTLNPALARRPATTVSKTS